MNQPILKLVVPALAAVAFTLIGATQASAKPTNQPELLACGTKGASCQGNADCCSGFSCKDNGRRSCQPD